MIKSFYGTRKCKLDQGRLRLPADFIRDEYQGVFIIPYIPSRTNDFPSIHLYPFNEEIIKELTSDACIIDELSRGLCALMQTGNRLKLPSFMLRKVLGFTEGDNEVVLLGADKKIEVYSSSSFKEIIKEFDMIAELYGN